jgi:hypothetical protein
MVNYWLSCDRFRKMSGKISKKCFLRCDGDSVKQSLIRSCVYGVIRVSKDALGQGLSNGVKFRAIR